MWKRFYISNDRKKHDKCILDLLEVSDGWIELADNNYRPLLQGKVLYSFDGKVFGVGLLKQEHLPAALISDIQVKIGPLLLDGHLPLCRFIIDLRGPIVILTELTDSQMKEKLKPYVNDYSKINLMIGLDSSESILIDNDEGIKDFEQIWQEAKNNNSLPSQRK